MVESSLGKSYRRGGTEYGGGHSVVAGAGVYLVPAERKEGGLVRDEEVDQAYSRVKSCLMLI